MSQHFAITVLVAVVFVGITSAVTAGDEEQPTFKITTKRDNDKVDVKVEKHKVVFAFRSPLGISTAIIERFTDRWPDHVTIKLFLKGLENLQISNGKVKLEASISSYEKENPTRLWKDGKEDSLLDSRSSFWMEIRTMEAGGTPTKRIPLKDGYFEMTLPTVLFEDNPESITVRWVDFYRG